MQERGYVSMRHNALRDREAAFLREICKDVKTEPNLLPTDADDLSHRTISTDGARLDISARGVWSTFERTFFDIRITHPNAPSNQQKTLAQLYKHHENEKKSLYNERVIQIEKGSFTPLVFATSGGMGPECNKFNKRVGKLLAEKRKESYSDVMCHIRTQLRFALLKSTLIAVRGIRGKTSKTESELELEQISFNLIPGMDQYEAP